VAELANRVAVMYAGRLVEEGTVGEIFSGARRHPYVAALINAIPDLAGDAADAHSIPGQVPNLAELPGGCRFAPRCPLVQPYCRDVEPPLVGEGGHRIACHVVNETLPTPEGVGR
jgi:peptide/nickel transport system ATP-binding protein